MNIRRVYPIRHTRNKWKIPLFCKHMCNENCNILIISNNSNQYILLENPDYVDGKCSYYNKLTSSNIKISTFNINNPQGDMGELYYSDMKVILDKSFIVSVYFPLSYVFEVVISAPNENDGFTLKELLYSIKNLYELIYEEEEETATPQIYNLKKFCTSCGNKDLSKYLVDLDINKKEELDECCICFSSEYENIVSENNYKTIKLKCKHVYHDNCIKTWLKTSGTCPMCRHNIFECNNCDGSGIIYYSFTGTVIPLEERGNVLNRNHSNGIFGIHSYDLEDLVINELTYDRKKKRLHMTVMA